MMTSVCVCHITDVIFQNTKSGAGSMVLDEPFAYLKSQCLNLPPLPCVILVALGGM